MAKGLSELNMIAWGSKGLLKRLTGIGVTERVLCMKQSGRVGRSERLNEIV